MSPENRNWKLEKRRLPWAAGEFERFGDGEKELFFERPPDELDGDGEAFGGSGNGNGEAGESGEIEPLAVAHGFAIAVNFFRWALSGPGAPSSFAMAERGRG